MANTNGLDSNLTTRSEVPAAVRLRDLNQRIATLNIRNPNLTPNLGDYTAMEQNQY